MPTTVHDLKHMQRALELAARGQGHVEPNPMVGCVVAHDDQVVGEGWHRKYGGPHAEIEALREAGQRASGATLYVTLEPCCHHGKTPPCSEAVIAAHVDRVVIAHRDPFESVSGGGIAQLMAAGINVETGLLANEAREINAPYLKLTGDGRPWVIAKWAMSLDGKLATRTGDSRWISNSASRMVVHQLRGRVDAVIVGRATAQRDDPLLTARPPGARTATRIVVDSTCQLSTSSQLAQTVDDAPVLIAASPDADPHNCQRLRDAGCEIVTSQTSARDERLKELLDELGQRRMTNVLVEGGGQLIGTLLDHHLVDEVHVFISPRLIGGTGATSIGGAGIELMRSALTLRGPIVQQLDGDIYVAGRLGER